MKLNKTIFSFLCFLLMPYMAASGQEANDSRPLWQSYEYVFNVTVMQ